MFLCTNQGSLLRLKMEYLIQFSGWPLCKCGGFFAGVGVIGKGIVLTHKMKLPKHDRNSFNASQKHPTLTTFCVIVIITECYCNIFIKITVLLICPYMRVF